MHCGGSGTSNTGSPCNGDSGNGTTGYNTAMESACADYFDALVGAGCSIDGFVGSGPAGFRARFVVLCASNLALSGQGTTVNALEACTALVKGPGGCASWMQEQGACAIPAGTSRDDAPCVSRQQCASGTCLLGTRLVDGAAFAEATCGICATSIPLGQACASTGAVCDSDAFCDPTSHVCKLIPSGATAGGMCTEFGVCTQGLFCDIDDGPYHCAPQSDAGAACRLDEACSPPLICNQATRLCQPAAGPGAVCARDADCGEGLVCVLGPGLNPVSGQCGVVAYVAPGQLCDNEATRCRAGACLGVDAGCPNIIPDGQPCAPTIAGTTCDTLAACENGVCTLDLTQICQ